MTLPFTMSRRGWTLLAVLVPLLLLFAWVAFRSGPLAPVNVTVAQVEERSISPAMFGIGTVEARYTQKVGPTAAGRVTMVAVDVGDTVVAGQLLAQIDPIDLDQRIDAAADRAVPPAAASMRWSRSIGSICASNCPATTMSPTSTATIVTRPAAVGPTFWV